jgi:post-segregation antitoxin (ccd killing protein)
MVKQKLTLSIDKEIIAKARKAEINFSAFVEMQLIYYLTRKQECSLREGNPYLLVNF